MEGWEWEVGGCQIFLSHCRYVAEVLFPDCVQAESLPDLITFKVIR